MKVSDRYPVLLGHSETGDTNLHSVQEVAEFICKEGAVGDVEITLKDGTPFLSTFGIYLNRIADMDYREELLEVLIPMQHELEYAAFEGDSEEPDITM